MLHVILYEPEIPPNTGNIIRLCANTGVRLHLIHPLGFRLDAARVKRAGLDYRELVSVHEHTDLRHCMRQVSPSRMFAVSTRGSRRFADVSFLPDDAFLFGPETRGLPQTLLDTLAPGQVLRRIPMCPDNRSLNLSNAVAVVIYEAWRQLGFDGAE